MVTEYEWAPGLALPSKMPLAAVFPFSTLSILTAAPAIGALVEQSVTIKCAVPLDRQTLILVICPSTILKFPVATVLPNFVTEYVCVPGAMLPSYVPFAIVAP